MQFYKLVPQLLIALNALWVNNNGVINRADLLTGRGVVVSYAFGTALAVNFVELIPHRNRLVRALRLTHIAIDTFFGDQQRHGSLSY